MKFWKMEGLGNDFVVVTGPRRVSPAGGVGPVRPAPRGGRRRDAGDLRRGGAGGDDLLQCRRIGGRDVRERAAMRRPVGGGSGYGRPLRVRGRDSRGSQEGASRGVGDHRRTGAGESRPSRRTGERVFHLVSVGNPHAVTWVEDPEVVPLVALAEAMQGEFDSGVNVEVVRVESPGRLSMRVWERGVGETAACGTGAAAAAAAGVAQGLTRSEVQVSLRGGRATVKIDEETSWITGPARLVFRGEWVI